MQWPDTQKNTMKPKIQSKAISFFQPLNTKNANKVVPQDDMKFKLDQIIIGTYSQKYISKDKHFLYLSIIYGKWWKVLWGKNNSTLIIISFVIILTNSASSFFLKKQHLAISRTLLKSHLKSQFARTKKLFLEAVSKKTTSQESNYPKWRKVLNLRPF